MKARIDYVRWFAGIDDYEVCNKKFTRRGSWEHLEANRYEFGNPYIRNFITSCRVWQPSSSVVEEFREDGKINEDEYSEIMWRIGVVEGYAREAEEYDREMSEIAARSGRRRRTVSVRKTRRRQSCIDEIKKWVPKLDEATARASGTHLYENTRSGVGLRDVIEERLLVQLKNTTEEVEYLKHLLVFTDGEEIESGWWPEEEEGF